MRGKTKCIQARAREGAMPAVKVLISDTHNPWFNLATEEWIYREMDPSVQTLFLWRNAETVVVGRNQNPWGECNLAKMGQDGVKLARRTTGGGAVFHDLGNTCFTFLSPKAGYDRNTNVGIILAALKTLGIEAAASGRNDITIETEDGQRKVSGSAYRESRDRAFHHGTLLLNADLSRLANYLTPHPKKLLSKGRTSVRARVMNLGEINPKLRGENAHEVISGAVIDAFFEKHGSRCEIEHLDHSTLQSIEGLKASYDEFSSWEWRFGHAPQFNLELAEYLSWGFVQIFIDSEKGRITRLQIFSDALFTDLVEDFQKCFDGQPMSQAGVSQAIAATLVKHPAMGSELRELETWLKTQVEI
jgi:lipoate-protein ligase A